MGEITEHDVIGAIIGQGGKASLLGGRAVAIACGDAMPQALRRVSSDIDIVVRGRDRKPLKAAMAALGCEGAAEFNLLNGKERMIFFAGDTKIDVFIDVFRMCHMLDLGARVGLHDMILPPADLLLTKLQVVRLDRKDLIDIAALLLCCKLSEAPGGIEAKRVTGPLGADWGFWRTATGTLDTLRARAAEICGDPELGATLVARIDALGARIAAAPRSMAWKLRAVIGERSKWYELPEEPDAEPAT
ncbi:MAG: hypothetical protein POH28_07405 [Acidocella sp.]|nr:hypothetical protein [Acidocella sp.]